MMKPVIIITVAFVLFIPLSTFAQGIEKEIYSNKLYDFSITPPEDWDTVENIDDNYVYYQAVFAPSNYYSDGLIPQIAVSYSNVGEQDDPFISDEELLKNYNKLLHIQFPSAKIISQDIEKKSWGWVIMREAVVTQTYYIDESPYSLTLPMHSLQYYLHFKNGDVYIVAYTSDEDSFDSFYSVAIESIKTFEAKDTKPFSTESIIGGGGCLIATATYGSELAPQVQQLRELRDNTLLQTESGTNFMNSFNNFYYSFSPIIADYERENPIFKEMVKVAITPMITSLSLMEYADSEESVLGIGISLIVLNGLMYVGIPTVVIMRFRK